LLTWIDPGGERMLDVRSDDPVFMSRLFFLALALAASVHVLPACESDEGEFQWVLDAGQDPQPDLPQADAPLPDVAPEPWYDQPVDAVQEPLPDPAAEIALVDEVEDVPVEEPPPPPEYPAGPYGTHIGDRIQNLTFLTVDGTNVSLRDYYQDTTRKLLLVYQTAGWCSACAYESRHLNGIYTSYWSRGLSIMAAVFEDDYGYPATREYAQEYARTYGFLFTTVVDSPSQLNAYCHEELSPMNLLIDLSTMNIVDIQYGYDDYYDPIEEDIEYYLSTITR
jgi:peroxiredoxin